MPISVRPAKREDVWLLTGLAGGTGSGKTWSGMSLAKGLAGGGRFGVIDTENGRASHYADRFEFDVADLSAPFRPERYQEAVDALIDHGHHVIMIDSMSHEWDGVDGMLEWQEEEFQRLGGRDQVKMTSWIKPKQGHRKFVNHLLQVRAHIVLCFRAAEKVEMVRDEQGKMQVIPKRSLTGLGGWVPISEKNLPYELTLSVLLTADQPGVPKPIKLQEQHRAFVPLDRPLDEQVGVQLARWAAPGTSPAGSHTPEATPNATVAPGDPQMARLAVAFNQAGIDKPDRLAWVNQQLSRTVNSPDELTLTETEQLIAELKQKGDGGGQQTLDAAKEA